MRVFLLACLLATGLFAQETVVFRGVPQVRFDADGRETNPHALSDEGGQKGSCRIVSKGKRFYWASRGNRELIRADAGDYTYYISPEGSGYVKIFTGASGGAKPPFDYMEQLTSELKTFTYWGKTQP
jgi:hypothetical protein